MSRNKERRRHHLLRKLQRREGEGRKAYLARQSAIRFARNQIAELELKRQPIPSNADRLRHRLMFEKVSQALDLTIKKLIRTDDPYSRHPAVDAFVTVLFDLPSDCEAAVTAAGIAEEIGMPLDGDRDREVVMDWLRLPPSTLPSGLAGELLPVGRRIGGHPRLGQRPGHGAARQHRASPPQPRACRVSVNRSTGQQVNRSTGQQVNRSTGQAATHEQNGATA